MYIVYKVKLYFYQMNNISSSVNQNVAVIGAGVIGISTAIRLQQLGYQVTLLDSKGISEGCSKGNAGHFATEQVFPLAQTSILPQLPKMLLDPKGALRISPSYLFKALPWFMRFLANMRPRVFNRNKDALKQLNQSAINAWQRLTKATNTESLFHLNGSLLTFESDSRKDALVTRAHYKKEGVNVKLLERHELDELQPGLHPAITHALYFTDVGHTCSPYKLNMALFDYAKSLGVNFKQVEVTSLFSNDSGITINANDNALVFDKLVMCTGAHSKALCKQLGYKVPLDTERGYHYMVSSEQMPTMPVVSFEKKFILTPMQEGLRLAGTVEFAGLSKAPTYRRADMLKQLGESIWPDMVDDHPAEDKKWMGFRPTLPDSLPVIGRAPKHNNVFFNFGHQHLGLTLAAISAELITAEVQDATPQIDLTPYSIARFN
ncbi:NAD(P)/FAD-dependent oxidoreductase [Pseudoalteromonas piratica]|nr:FAD-dependent oxidoreductase [Pseudoalteromonas piratica]